MVESEALAVQAFYAGLDARPLPAHLVRRDVWGLRLSERDCAPQPGDGRLHRTVGADDEG
jgi:hypothetical protein